MTATRTKEERLASLNSRLEYVTRQLSAEKNKLYRLQDDYKAAKEESDSVRQRMRYHGETEFPSRFDTHAEGKAYKAWQDQIAVTEACEKEQQRIMQRIDVVSDER